jgi:arabinogalactan oligomer/maltooligosaccharide transport system substrate-binding protein
MKKITTLMLALTIVFVMSACGSTKDTTGTSTAPSTAPTAAATADAGAATPAPAADTDLGLKPEAGATITVWDDKDTRNYHEAVIKEFEAKYKIKVKFEEVAPADQAGKFITDGPAGVAADVAVIPHDNLGRMVSAGLLLPNDTFAEGTKRDYLDAAVQAATFNNVLYGYPKSVETYALFYNKALVKTPPKTFDDVKAFAKTFNDPAKNKYGFMMELGNFYYNYAFMATAGGYVFGKNGTDPTDVGLNNDGAVKGAAFFASLKKDILPMKSADVTYDIKKGLFTSGSLAMDLNGPWTVGDYKKAGIDIGVVPLPSIDGKPTVSFAGIKILAVSAFSKYPIASKLYAHFASSKESELTNFKLSGSLPANKEAINDPSIKNDDISNAFLDQMKNAQPMPSIPEMGNIWGPMGAALGDMWNDGKDPKASLDNAVKQIKEANAAKK